MTDLFNFNKANKNAKPDSAKLNSYTAKDIEVLEGLEPVRLRPGMYIGGTDEDAMHHLVSEVLDNAMDEAIAGFATIISIEITAGGIVTIADNGRGIPVDNHPKFPDKSALEVILTTLHSGGKFNDKIYHTPGGLHGVGISVVNALSDYLQVEVYRNGLTYTQNYACGIALSRLQETAGLKKQEGKQQGTKISFHPDPEIFGDLACFKARRIYELAKSKAYLHKGVKISWFCEQEIIAREFIEDIVPARAVICFPDGLKGYLGSKIDSQKMIVPAIFAGEAELKAENIRLEWAICWHEDQGFIQSYCNTILTPSGGTHEQGNRSALLRSLKDYGEMTGNKKIQQVTAEDILESAGVVLSVFIKNPIFQGQTKEKLVSKEVAKHVENIIKDHFDHWLSNNKESAELLVGHVIHNAEYRLNKKNDRIINRKTAIQKLRLPGKLADCSRSSSVGTELFLVEGDSAGGSAKQARDRETQAVLPLRGKILNVATAHFQKISSNQEIQDLEIALACGSMHNYKEAKLRYEKIIIMTDADVDGAHIAALLMTFFFLRMRQLIQNGHLYLARPPLYRLTQNNKTYYAADDKQKQEIFTRLTAKSRSKVEIGRFKGLGEMTPAQLKETTMSPERRVLHKVNISDIKDIEIMVDNLMGKHPEKRFRFIQEQALEAGQQAIALYI